MNKLRLYAYVGLLLVCQTINVYAEGAPVEERNLNVKTISLTPQQHRISESLSTLNASKAEVEADENTVSNNQQTLKQAQESLDASQKKLEASKRRYNDAKASYEASQKALDQVQSK